MIRVPTAVSVTLILMGTLLLALPAIYEMVMAGQESYVLAHNPGRIYIRHELDWLARMSFLVGGIAMIFLGIKLASIAPAYRNHRPSHD